MADPEPKLEASFVEEGGTLYACGSGKFGSLPVGAHAIDASGDVVFPVPVRLPKPAAGEPTPKFVRCAADMGVFAALDTRGSLWVWGRGSSPAPLCASAPVTSFDVGAAFVVYVSAGVVWTAVPSVDRKAAAAVSARVATARPTSGSASPPVFSSIAVALPPDAGTPVTVTAASRTYAILTEDGSVWSCGDAENNGLGVRVSVPTRVAFPSPVCLLSIGSAHGVAVTTDNRMFAWGDGRNGCLGVLPPRVHLTPAACDAFLPDGVSITYVSATRGQPGPLAHIGPGSEGPRTHVVTSDGGLYIAGTGHKGLAADHISKVMSPKQDHTTLYRVGGRAADVGAPPVPTGAVEDFRVNPTLSASRMGMDDPALFGKDGNTNYLTGVRIISSQPSHIHSVALSSDGRLFAWGCGSNGRTGLAGYLRGPGGSKRRMKCYISTPSVVEALEGKRVIAAATGRYWTLAIVKD